MKIKMEKVFTGILVICAMVITVIVLFREFSGNESTNISIVKNWRILIPQNDKKEDINNKIYLFEFFDYECTYCNGFDATLDTIQSKYKDKIKIVRYHYPLNIHPFAYRAAIAAECAGKQNYFEKYHKQLMTNQIS